MSYTVCEAFIEMRDGKAVHHKEVGSVIELDDETAGPLLEAGTVARVGGEQWQEAVTLDDVKKYAVSSRHRGEPTPAADEPTDDEPAAESGEA